MSPLLVLEIFKLGIPICQQQQIVFEQVITIFCVCDNWTESPAAGEEHNHIKLAEL